MYYVFQKKELVDKFGVYISYLDLESKELASKGSATGLMRQLMSVWYKPQRLAASSASSGINEKIRTAIFSKSIYKLNKLAYYVHINFFLRYNSYHTQVHIYSQRLLIELTPAKKGLQLYIGK